MKTINIRHLFTDLVANIFEQCSHYTFATIAVWISIECIFIRDVTYPDNEIVNVNQEFEKIWEIRNIGNVTWENRFLMRVDSPEGDGALICSQERVPIPEEKSGENVKIAV